ncbi:MAG: hypothetical protein IJI46_05230 [Erysipelotrichaceae bacterium]|nr:hypothetical protein [Erysipelotrichaceae bacterium]
MKDFFKKHRLIVSLAVNLILMLYFLAFFYCAFETDDDYSMKMIAMGAYGSPDAHLVFINPIIGYLLSFLYRIIPGLAWYEGFQYLMIFLSLSTITYVLSDRENDLLQISLMSIFLFLAGRFFYSALQFTKTACILAVAGYLLLAWSLEKDRKAGIIFSLVLILLSPLFRVRQFYLVSLPCVCLFMPLILSFIKDRQNKNLQKKVLKLLICGLVCFVLMNVNRYIGRLSYQESAWKAFKAYNSTRAALLDRGEIDYRNDALLYQDLGLSQTDLEMLYDLWDFDDPDIFTSEMMEEILERQTTVKKGVLDGFKELVFETIAFFFENKEGVAFTLFFLGLFILQLEAEKDLDEWITFILCVLLTLFCIVFSYIFRNFAYLGRVHLSILFSGITILLYKRKNTFGSMRLVPAVLAVLIIMISCSFIYFDEFRINSSKRIRDELKISALKQIRQDNTHLYLRTTDEGLDYVSGLFLGDDSYNVENLCSLGGWLVNMPLNEELKQRYNVRNPFKDIVNNDDVYLIISDEEKLQLIIKYINIHYDDKAKAEVVSKIEANKDYTIYRVVSE